MKNEKIKLRDCHIATLPKAPSDPGAKDYKAHHLE